MSGVNECTRNIHVTGRKDAVRSGVTAQKQKATSAPLEAVCPKKSLRVHRNADGTGGCCPDKYPTLINGRCYASCDDGDHSEAREALVLGAMVACRAHCPNDWTEHTNDCTKDGEEARERGDFPRLSVAPLERKVQKKVVSNGCPVNFVRASKRRCCPATEPLMYGLLCYEECPHRWEEINYGCYSPCPKGYKAAHFECRRHGAPTIRRKTFERHPVLPKFAK